MRAGRRRRSVRGITPNYIDGQWTGPDVWETGNGEPSEARRFAERLGYDWKAHRVREFFHKGDENR